MALSNKIHSCGCLSGMSNDKHRSLGGFDNKCLSNNNNNNNGVKIKIPQANSRLINMNNPIAKSSAYETSELFDKVKRQLNNYLEKVNACKVTTCVKERPSDVIMHVTKNGMAIFKNSNREIVDRVISSSLNNREKSLLKFLIKSNETPPNRHIFLAKALQQHLHDCLTKITSKIGIENDLLELVDKCPVILNSRSYEQIGKEEVGLYQSYKNATLRNVTIDVVGDLALTGIVCGGKPLKTSVLYNVCSKTVGVKQMKKRCAVENNGICHSCCVIALLDQNYQLLDIRERYSYGYEYSEESPIIKRSNFRLACVTESALMILTVDLMYYSLETTADQEENVFQHEIYFSYQSNPYNHLLHLYLGLKHQND